MSYLETLFSLEGKVAIVTGSARGNGLAIARALSAARARCFMVDVREAELREAATGFSDAPVQPTAIALDLTNHGAPERLVDQVVAEAGRVDVLVNNAGITRSADVLDYPESDWDATQAINLKAPFLLSKAAAVAMEKNGGGSIINITSLNAEQAFPNNPAYVASKGGLKMLGKSLALDLGVHGIRVNNVGPGYFRTELNRKSWDDPERRRERSSHTILGRWGDPERDLPGIVIFLASDASSYVTGQDIYIDGGWLAKGL
jgi:NAD(P)-dependent dehydrogenase (short-subunit alcohol dehydrogenase family)